MERQKQAYLYAAVAVLCWATVASAFKITLRHMDFVALLFYAAVASTAALFLVLLAQGKLSLLRTYSGRDYIRSAALGFLNPFLYYLILFRAYELLPAQEAQPLNWTWPIMLVVLSIPLLKQRIGLANVLAIIISFLGVMVISTHGDILGLRFTNIHGVLLATGSSVVWASFWIYNIRDPRDEVAKLFLNFLFGSAFAAVPFLLYSQASLSEITGLLGACYVGVFEMGLTFVVWLKALKLSRTTAQVSNLIYAAPFLSLVPIHFVVGEKILLSSVVGLSFIITGIVMQRHVSRARTE